MKKLTILIALVIFIGFIAGCGSDNQAVPGNGVPLPGSSGADEGQADDTGVKVVVGCGMDMQWGSLDPINADGGITGVMPLAFEGLVKEGQAADGGAAIEPCLAESWTIGEDGLTYTFKLKPDVKFADGTPVTLDDWIWSLERARDTEDSPWAGYAAPIKTVTAHDDETLVIELSDITPQFLSLLTLSNFAVQSQKRAEASGIDGHAANPLGTGQFYFDGGDAQEYFYMAKNPFYHKVTGSNVDYLLFKNIKDDNDRIAQLQAGKLDVILNPPPEGAVHLMSDENIAVESYASAEQRCVNFNVTKPPLDNSKVRRALRMATDKDKIINTVIFDCGKSAYSIFPDSGLYFNGGVYDEGFDIDKATALLAEAGFPDGFETEISFTKGNPVAEGIAGQLKEQWAKIGVKLELAAMDGADFAGRLDALDYSVTLLRWSDDTNDPVNLADFIGNYGVSRGFHTGYENPRVTELVREAGSTNDPVKREAAYREAQQIIYHEAPFYPLYRTTYIVAARNNISGFNQTAFGAYVLEDLRKN